MNKNSFLIAQFGRSVGLKGELKLNLYTDFPKQFVKGRVLKTDRGEVEIENYNPKRALIKIVGYDTPEDAKKLTNAKIYSNAQETQEYCKLGKGEYFWFDLIGLKVEEGSEILGVVKEIQRLPQSDYFLITTSDELVQQGMSKSFLLPYLPNFVQKVDLEAKKIITQNAKDILEAS